MSEIIIPGEQANVYVLNKANGQNVFVAECPGCRFNGLAICVATVDKSEVPKAKYLAEKEFPKLWQKMSDKFNESR